MGNRSENTRPRKIQHGRVFYILFYILHSKISENAKQAAAQNFTRPRVILRGRVPYLIKSKLIVLPSVYQLSISSFKCRKTYSIVIQRRT